MPIRPIPFQTIPAPLYKALWSTLALSLVPCLGACMYPRPTQELLETSRFRPLTAEAEVWNFAAGSYDTLRSPVPADAVVEGQRAFGSSPSPRGTRWAIQRTQSDWYRPTWDVVRSMADGSVESFTWDNISSVKFVGENWVMGRREAVPHWQGVIRHVSGEGVEIVVDGPIQAMSIGDDGSALWSDGKSCFVGSVHKGQWQALDLSALEDGWKSTSVCVIVPGVAFVINQWSTPTSDQSRVATINAQTRDSWIFPDMYLMSNSPEEDGLIACRRLGWRGFDSAVDWIDVSQWPPRVARSCELPSLSRVAHPSSDGKLAFGFKGRFHLEPNFFAEFVLFDLSGPTARTYQYPKGKHGEYARVVDWIRADMREQQDDRGQKDTQSKDPQSSTTH